MLNRAKKLVSGNEKCDKIMETGKVRSQIQRINAITARGIKVTTIAELAVLADCLLLVLDGY
jgi:hypothetical protein